MNPIIKHPTTGKLIDFAPMHRSERFNFIHGALPTAPAWLATTGTVLHDNLSGNYGFMRLTSGTTVGDRGEVRTNWAVGLTQPAAMMITVEGMRLQNDVASDWVLALEDSSRTLGVSVRQMNADTQAKIVLNGTAESTPINYAFKSSTALFSRRRNLSLLYLRYEKLAVVLADGEVVGYADATNIVTGNAIPRVYAATQLGGTAVALQVGAIQLDLWH